MYTADALLTTSLTLSENYWLVGQCCRLKKQSFVRHETVQLVCYL